MVENLGKQHDYRSKPSCLGKLTQPCKCNLPNPNISRLEFAVALGSSLSSKDFPLSCPASPNPRELNLIKIETYVTIHINLFVYLQIRPTLGRVRKQQESPTIGYTPDGLNPLNIKSKVPSVICTPSILFTQLNVQKGGKNRLEK